MKKSQAVKNKKKVLWDTGIQKDYLIPARRPDLVLTIKKKRSFYQEDFTILADQRVKKKKERKKIKK